MGVVVMNVNHERIAFSCTAFLSGCVPISLIYFFKTTICPFISNRIDYNFEYNHIQIFSIAFLVITLVSSGIFFFMLKKKFIQASDSVTISNLKRKDLFSSGALGFYVLPFISFLGNDMESLITIIILVLLLLRIFTNNVMFLYTPFIDILGYKMLEGTVTYNNNGSVKKQTYNIMVKSDKNLFFSTDNKCLMNQLNENTICVNINL